MQNKKIEKIESETKDRGEASEDTSDSEQKFEEYDLSKIKCESFQDFLLFISNKNKQINNLTDNYMYSYSKDKKKEISKYFKGLYVDYLSPSDIPTIFKAFIGAAFNCGGLFAASKVMKKFGLIEEECICANEALKNNKQQSFKQYHKITSRFDSLVLQPEIEVKEYVKFVEKLTGYKFEHANVLIIACTHKSKGRNKNGNIWDDYNLLEYLGDSVIKFFNCKRIISKRKELLKNKEKNFSDIQRLKFIRTASEKNLLFSFICVDTGLFEFIRHETKNEETIRKYKEYVDRERGNIDVDELNNYHIKMLADVIEAIIGAILIDSGSIDVTEKAWSYLFEEYLTTYADNPKVPPKRAFVNYCDKKKYLKEFKECVQRVDVITRESLMQNYGIEEQNSVINLSLVYKEKIVFCRYYASSVKSKDKNFYLDLKKQIKKSLVPNFKRDQKFDSQYRRWRMLENQDFEGEHRSDPKYIKAIFGEDKARKIRKEIPKSDERNIQKVTAKSFEDEEDAKCMSMFNVWLFSHYLETEKGENMIHDIHRMIK